MIKVSIIVPVYNTSAFLSKCLDSIVNQTLKEIEIICVNDGSTDGSFDIMKQYADHDSRVKVIDKNNTGYGHTMNVGLAHASGQYIGIVESDDFISPDMYEKLYEAAIESEAEIVKSNYYEYNLERGIHGELREVLEACYYNKVFAPIGEPNIFHARLCIWSAIYKRDFMERNNIFFHETAGASYQDISFNFKVLAMAARVLLLRDAFVFYRTDSAYSSTNNIKKIFCVADEFKELDDFVETLPENKKQLSKIEVCLKVKTYLWNYNRLASVFQYTFLIRMVEEFKKEYEAGRLVQEDWSTGKWSEIEQIIYHTDTYFYQTCKDFKDHRLQGIMNDMDLNVYKSGLLERFKQYDQIIIYGAGALGKKVLETLSNRRTPIEVTRVAVSDKAGNPEYVKGIPVYPIEDLLDYRKHSIVLVATKEAYLYEIVQNLKLLQFEQIMPVHGILKRCLFDSGFMYDE